VQLTCQIFCPLAKRPRQIKTAYSLTHAHSLHSESSTGAQHVLVAQSYFKPVMPSGVSIQYCLIWQTVILCLSSYTYKLVNYFIKKPGVKLLSDTSDVVFV